jgi:adenosylcobinamide kinase/adenosylcobinamide-phosphate guanylyltransferase
MKSSLLVIGGARSGKSRYAQARAEALHGELIFLATAQSFDDEMAHRIARHQGDRGPRWRTVEEPLELPSAIAAHARPDRVVLIDCLTLWASNLLFADRDTTDEPNCLAKGISEARGPVILVANEVGLGIVPDNALARRFRDFAGTINQILAGTVDEVVMTVAGIPLQIKPNAY